MIVTMYSLFCSASASQTSLPAASRKAHVDGAVGFGRRADAEEDDLGVLDGGLHVFGELQLPDA
jgi:hypothetical protein